MYNRMSSKGSVSIISMSSYSALKILISVPFGIKENGQYCVFYNRAKNPLVLKSVLQLRI